MLKLYAHSEGFDIERVGERERDRERERSEEAANVHYCYSRTSLIRTEQDGTVAVT